MTKRYISDTHFGHKNIIGYCERGFASVEEMDAHMLTRLQQAEQGDTELFHLGDFGWIPSKPENRRRAGIFQHSERHTFIAGNHDKVRNYRSWYERHFGRVVGNEDSWEENHLIVKDQAQGRSWTLLLTHAPWRELPDGVDLNLYGHHHSNLLLDREYHRDELGWLYASLNHINVSVELLNYMPRTLGELLYMRQELDLELH